MNIFQMRPATVCLTAALLFCPASVALAKDAAAPAAIDEQMFVPIGGIAQWITIKGDDRRHPVVLVLHGGPGDAWSPFADAMFADWKKDFTLVQWDQRGAGRTYGRSGPSIEPTMTIARMVQDGIEVSEFLAKHLDKKKIFILGGSWGSVLGIEMAHARPDLFDAYVGMGQVVNWRRNLAAGYARVLEMARTADDRPAVEALTSIGPPPWDKLSVWPKFRKWERIYQGKIATSPPAPRTIDPAYASPQELAQYDAADDFSFVHFMGMNMSGPFAEVDLPALGTGFAIPVYIVQGEADLTTVPELAKAYFDTIQAPRKRFTLVPGAGHEPSLATLELARTALLEEAGRAADGR